MPLVEQELLILPEKMSSHKVLMGFILLDLKFPVSWGGGGGGKSPLLYRSTNVDHYISGQWNFEGARLFKNFTGPWGQLIFFLKSTPA